MIDATPLLRLWARRRLRHLSAMDPAAVQQAELLKLVRAAAQTRFGRAHGFARIRTAADFQAAVPVRDYDAFRDDIWGTGFPQLADIGWPGPVNWFALIVTNSKFVRLPSAGGISPDSRLSAS